MFIGKVFYYIALKFVRHKSKWYRQVIFEP